MRRVIFFICSTILLLPTFLYAQEYKYPVQPGAPEWIMCKSYMERVDLCQIPEDVLAAMSTKDLLISCLHHPFNINIFAYDLPKYAAGRMVETFNVFNAAISRLDFSIIAIDALSELEAASYEEGCSFETQVERTILFGLLEFVGYEIQNTLLDDNMINAVIRTPNGAIVDDCYYLNYPIEYDLEEINEQWRRRYPSITILANSSNSYNCHAYAWHMTEGGEDVWMGYYTNPTDIYWTDNSYKQVNRRYSGLKVAFPYDNHSAVSTSQNGILISKWGSGPLVRHSVNDCPYVTISLRYYTKNVLLNSHLSGRFAQNANWRTLRTVNPVDSRTSPITLNINCPNAFFVEWELIEGGSDVQWGEEGLGIAGITMNSSSSVGLKATAYTPDGRIESSFYFFCNN